MDWTRVARMIQKDFPDVPSITTDELANWLDDPTRQSPVLLDARAKKEFDVGHLPGAVLAIDADAAETLLASFEKSAPVVVYCSVGYRSAKMTMQLADLGWTQVFNLQGSIFQWANQGRPVFVGENASSSVHPYDRKWGRLLDSRWHP